MSDPCRQSGDMDQQPGRPGRFAPRGSSHPPRPAAHPTPFRKGPPLVTIFLKTERTVDDYRADEAWHCYYDAFGALEALAVQQHVMTRRQFNEQMADQRVDKILALDEDGDMSGVATMTNDLFAVPLISPRWFEVNYRRAFAAKAIWYVPFIAIPRSDEGAFTAIIEHVHGVAARAEGMVIFDACNYNLDQLGFARAIEAWTIRLSGGRASAFILDAQRYIGFDVTGANSEPGRRLPDGIGVRR